MRYNYDEISIDGGEMLTGPGICLSAQAGAALVSWLRHGWGHDDVFTRFLSQTCQPDSH